MIIGLRERNQETYIPIFLSLSMVLTNGSGFTISGNVATKGADTHCWCYDSTVITITQALKYYFNGVLQYTSTGISSGDYYPYLSARGSDGDQWTYSRGVDDIGSYINWVPNFDPGAGGKYLGGNHDIADVEDDISFGDHIGSPGLYDLIRENNVAVHTIPGTPNVAPNDTFKIYYAAASTSGSFLPPPPITVQI